MTRIVLVDDHNVVRDGLRVLLEKEQGIEVIGEADDGRTAVSLCRELGPDVAVMDISMPGLNGIEATRQILQECGRTTKVIALSIHSDRRFVTEMLKAGASGYLPKHCAFGELARAIREVMDERVYLSPKVAGGVVEDYMRHLNHASDSAFSVLAGRDREVLQLLAEGKSSKEIAKGLHLSVKTVEWYRREIMNKLGIHTMAGLIKYAIREGLTSPEA